MKIFEQGSLLEAQQEAELAATLAQPGVVTYTGVGQDPTTNKPCVHMEYFEGSNLERSIATTGPLTSKQSAQLILQITRVLANFHDARGSHATNGVVHRDIKPANIFLKRWQREMMVGRILFGSVVAKMNFTCGGGSSKVFRRALNAAVVSMWTSSIKRTPGTISALPSSLHSATF